LAGRLIERETHTVSSVKIGGEPVQKRGILQRRDPLALNLHWEFPKIARQNGFFTFSDRL
jgi:hypothetical protein